MTIAMKKARTVQKAAKPDKTTIQVRMDVKTKDKVARFFKRHGMSTSDGVRALLDRVIRDETFPFDPDAPHEPNEATQMAILQCRNGGGTPVTREGLRKMWDEA